MAETLGGQSLLEGITVRCLSARVPDPPDAVVRRFAVVEASPKRRLEVEILASNTAGAKVRAELASWLEEDFKLLEDLDVMRIIVRELAGDNIVCRSWEPVTWALGVDSLSLGLQAVLANSMLSTVDGPLVLEIRSGDQLAYRADLPPMWLEDHRSTQFSPDPEDQIPFVS